MSARLPNPKLVKINRDYLITEITLRLKVHKNTVRNWIKRGLPTIDDKKPSMIHGPTLREFLTAKRSAGRQRCPPGHLYCVRCRAPKMPDAGEADYVPLSPASGNLRGICPDCGLLMHRRVSRAKLHQILGHLTVELPEAV